MKIINVLILSILALCILFSCDLPRVDDCDALVSFDVEKEIDCPVPCEVLFINTSTGAYDAAQWNFGDGETSRELETTTHTYLNPGKYEVVLTLTGSGCPPEDHKASVNIGVDPVQAIIIVDREECIVGDCEIVFTSESENADTWYWEIPGQTDDYRNQSGFSIPFNDCPDTINVILIAENAGGSSRDTVTIFVEPYTFIVESFDLPDLTNVLCIEEKPDGSFMALGNNTDNSYSFELTREGQIMESSIVFFDALDPIFGNRTASNFVDLSTSFVGIGTAIRNNNNDIYLVAVNSNFALEREVSLITESDGQENGFGITEGIDGGFVICGSNSGNGPDGMAIIKVNDSFDDPQSAIIFEGASINQAFDITTLDNEYFVIGVALHQSAFDGCYFRMDENLELIPESVVTFPEFIPQRIIKLDNNNLVLIGAIGNTGVVHLIGDNPGSRSFGNTTFNHGIITHDQKLALAGATGTNVSKRPLLMVLQLPDLDSQLIINEPYPVPEGEFFWISETKEHGFVLGGSINNGNTNHKLIIRTNKNGIIN